MKSCFIPHALTVLYARYKKETFSHTYHRFTHVKECNFTENHTENSLKKECNSHVMSLKRNAPSCLAPGWLPMGDIFSAIHERKYPTPLCEAYEKESV